MADLYTSDTLKVKLRSVYSTASTSRLLERPEIQSDPDLVKSIQVRASLISIRATSFFVEKYGTRDDVEKIIESLNPKHYAFAFHDKDSGKTPHWHILLVFSNTVSSGSILKVADRFGENTFIEKPKSGVRECFDYLLHQSKSAIKSNKYPYPPETRVSDDEEYFLSLSTSIDSETDTVFQCVEEILEGRTSTRELLRKYGRDFCFHYNDIYGMAKRIRAEEEHDTRELCPAYMLEEIECLRNTLNAERQELNLLADYLKFCGGKEVAPDYLEKARQMVWRIMKGL